MPEPTDSELQWQHDVQLLQSAIVQLPRNDPGRQLLQRDLDRKFREKYSDKPPVTGGGLNWNTKTGLAAVSYMKGDASG